MLATKGSRLAEGEEFEIRMFKFTIMFNRISNVEACTFAPLLANPCYAVVLSSFVNSVSSFIHSLSFVNQ